MPGFADPESFPQGYMLGMAREFHGREWKVETWLLTVPTPRPDHATRWRQLLFHKELGRLNLGGLAFQWRQRIDRRGDFDQKRLGRDNRRNARGRKRKEWLRGRTDLGRGDGARAERGKNQQRWTKRKKHGNRYQCGEPPEGGAVTGGLTRILPLGCSPSRVAFSPGFPGRKKCPPL